jgi:hypothetical protein
VKEEEKYRKAQSLIKIKSQKLSAYNKPTQSHRKKGSLNKSRDKQK